MNARRLLLGLLLLVAPSAAKAQTGYPMNFRFYEMYYSADTAYGALTGAEVAVGIVAEDNYLGQGLGSFTIRIYYDPAVLSFDSVQSICPTAATQPITSVVGGNYVQLSAAGCANGTVYYALPVATVFLKMVSSTAGGMLYLSPAAVADRVSTIRTLDAFGDLAEVCRAQGLWGDVDGDDKVNSRDALIALSVAVGLPANGFNVARGDVDGDGQVTSRDALAMMSASINLYVGSGFRVGKGVVVACAPQTPLPRTLYYSAGVRNNVLNGRAGVNGLTIRPALDTAFTIVGDSAVDAGASSDQWRPRPSPSGAAVLFQCYYGGTTPQICKANADGSGLVRLTTSASSSYGSPDWSPAGDSIVYIQDYSIYVMAADGSGPAPVPSALANVLSVAWRPIAGSRRIAYANYSYEVHTRSMDAPNDSVIMTYASPSSFDYQFVDWSPDGDSLAFSRRVDNGGRVMLTVVPNLPTPARQNRISIANTDGGRQPLWTDQGILFEATPVHSQWDQLFLRRNNGTVIRVTRGPRDAHFPGMKKTP